jgi:hypothetical protein
MTLQDLPRRVASLSPSSPFPASNRPSSICPRLWPNLSEDARVQLAQAMAQLMRRHRQLEDASQGEDVHADDRALR